MSARTEQSGRWSATRAGRSTRRAAWTADDIPDQAGRVVLVTGANAGIGFETARVFASKGAEVWLACRDAARGRAACERIASALPRGAAGRAMLLPLDLADLTSVRKAADQFLAHTSRLDVLVNNAGVMVPPLGRTADGFELQFGTNHLGHVALTARLLPWLLATPGSRVVVVASKAQDTGRISFDDLQWERRPYSPWAAYSQSKLATMLFALELDRRLRAAGASTRCVAAHPGWTATDLQRTTALVRALNPLFAMRPEDGALPTLRAATDPDAEGGSYWGPSCALELRGPPGPARIPSVARDAEAAARLWEVSERLVGMRVPL